LLSNLVALEVYRNYLTGKIPSQMELLSSLRTLYLTANYFTGSIPTEIGLLSNLVTLELERNLLTGSIPSQIGSLSSLAGMELNQNELTGNIPSQIGLCSNLVAMILFNNSLTGSIPSQIGLCSSLFFLSLSNNDLSGTIPSELGVLTTLSQLSATGNSITGSVPPSLCANNANFGLRLYVDCNLVACTCCVCPSNSPSMSSMSPSDSQTPSLSVAPSTSPSRSHQPSSSRAPSFGPCSPFSSLAMVGTELSISDIDDGVDIVRLPFAFAWGGLLNFTHVTIASNGVIFLGNTTEDGCCSPFPIQLNGEYEEERRIAVAQSDLDPGDGGFVYTGIVGDAFVASWEGVPPYRSGAEYGLHFQAVLFTSGVIELRWGEGNVTSDYQFAAGLEDDKAGIVVPATGDPFLDNSGQTRRGIWPRDQCRNFFPNAGGSYLESG